MIPAHLPRLAERYDIPDDDLAEQAERAAGSVLRLADLWGRNGTADAMVLQALRRIAKCHAIRLPNMAGLAERVNRMSDAGWSS